MGHLKDLMKFTPARMLQETSRAVFKALKLYVCVYSLYVAERWDH